MRIPVVILLFVLMWGCSKSAAEGPDESVRIAQLEHENRVLKFRNDLEKAINGAETLENLCNEWQTVMSRYSEVVPIVDFSVEKKMYTKKANRIRTRMLKVQQKNIQGRCVQEGVGALRSWMESKGAYGWQVDGVENIHSAIANDGLQVSSTVKVRKEGFIFDDRERYIVTVSAQMRNECSSELTYSIDRIDTPNSSGGGFQ